MRFRRHPECYHHATEDGIWCTICLLLHLHDRIEKMPDQAALDAAVAAIGTAIDAGFADLTETVQSETALVVTALGNAGVPQEAIDAVNGLGAKLTAGFAGVKTAIQSELPAAG